MYPRIQDNILENDKEHARLLRTLTTQRVWGTFLWNPPSVAANSTADTTLTAADSLNLGVLVAGQSITVTPPSDLDAGLSVTMTVVSAAGQLTIRLRNHTGAPINQAIGTWAFEGTLP